MFILYIYKYALGSGLILGFIIYLRKAVVLPTFYNQDLPTYLNVISFADWFLMLRQRVSFFLLAFLT
jgi:hypothetical protein